MTTIVRQNLKKLYRGMSKRVQKRILQCSMYNLLPVFPTINIPVLIWNAPAASNHVLTDNIFSIKSIHFCTGTSRGGKYSDHYVLKHNSVP